MRKKASGNKPNAELLAAFKEADEIMKDPSKSKGYTDVDEMFKEILSSDE